jgi:hypothetical protein
LYPEDPGQQTLDYSTKTRLTSASEAKAGAALTDHIYMDAMGFGMGCCCLQLTFQACHVADARRMYDGLIPIGPILVSQMFISFGYI